VGGLSALIAWIGENEAVLSGGAALVVMIGFVASPLGAGLRGLVRRWSLSSSGAIEAQAATAPANDIPNPPEPEADRPSIAVLPFVSSSDDKDSEIFADGMTNDIITALGHVPGFFITSGNSTFVYKDQSVDTRQIGRELGVRYVVEGRVQRAGDDIRINTTLVEARTGEQIWSERFSGDLSDIFVLQDQVVQSIVGQLQPELMHAEWRRGSHMPTESLDAWTLLHSARMRFHLGHSRETVEEAIRLADAALEKDPNYAEAHGLLTEAFAYWVMIRWSDDPESDDERCAYHCRKALELGHDSVAQELDHPALVTGDARADYVRVQRLEGRNRAFLVGPHEARIADHVSNHYGGKPALHLCPPNPSSTHYTPAGLSTTPPGASAPSMWAQVPSMRTRPSAISLSAMG